MRDHATIQKRKRVLEKRARNRHVRKHRSRRPCNCVHSQQHLAQDLFEHIREVNGRREHTGWVQRIEMPQELCMLDSPDGEGWMGDLCDASIAAKCPYFTPIQTEEEAREAFDALVADEDWIKEHLPELATLNWVLEGEDPVEAPVEAAPPIQEETPAEEEKALIVFPADPLPPERTVFEEFRAWIRRAFR